MASTDSTQAENHLALPLRVQALEGVSIWTAFHGTYSALLVQGQRTAAESVAIL